MVYTWECSATVHSLSFIQYTIISCMRCKHRKLSTRGRLMSPCALNNPKKTTSRGLTTWCSPHMKVITVLLYRNFSKMLSNSNVLFCRRKITEQETNVHHTSGCQWLYSGRQPIIFFYIIYVWIIHRIVSLVSQFSVKNQIVLLLLLYSSINIR
jgi:hypothetical protein